MNARETITRTRAPHGGSSGDYHGIIVEESLRDPSVLDAVTILGRKKGTNWTLLRVGVEDQNLPSAIERVQQSLKVEGGVPFYAHFYRRGELIVVFPDQVFHVAPQRDTWTPVQAYGKSRGIPAEQLDFSPCRFDEETY